MSSCDSVQVTRVLQAEKHSGMPYIDAHTAFSHVSGGGDLVSGFFHNPDTNPSLD